jgi:hypothetical protein
MLAWTIAILAGLAWAAFSYLPTHQPARILLPAALRATAVALLVALLANAAIGRSRALAPRTALDVSASWTRGNDSTRYNAALRIADSLGGDSLVLFGDSVRAGTAPNLPGDASSSARRLSEFLLATGRAARIITDGVLGEPDALSALPSGSEIIVVPSSDIRDAAILSLEAPRAVVAGDTLEVKVTVIAGGAGAASTALDLRLGPRSLGSAQLDSFPAWAERSVVVRGRVDAGDDVRLLTASLRTGDDEPRNDTLAVAVEVTPAAGAVFISTSPDFDARDALTVLRGALAISTRGYYRVANGQWRVDGTLAPVTEEQVRQAALSAPLLVIHGDTAVFGAPRRVARGALALVTPPRERAGEWFVTAAPPSPLASALAGIPWDSLPPLDVVPQLPSGDWVGLESRRSRRFERREVMVGYEAPRRVVILGASGMWRWRFRGGVSADAFATVWGSMLDWLAADRPDVRAALPADVIARAGEPLRWRRGGADSVVTLVMRRRDGGRADSVTLRFAPGQTMAISEPVQAGVYDVTTKGGAAVLAVNSPRELLPARATVRSGAVGSGSLLSDARRARSAGWMFAIAAVLLCLEWLARRRLGLK